MKKIKLRLDQRVQQLYPQLSRAQIQSFIMQGKILVENHPVTKPGTLIDVALPITLLQQEPKYVSRAGYKLERALQYFNIDVKDKVVLDAGLSTGGFTDCLLQHGAAKIYGIDVGYGQVHEKIQHDPRVVVMERTNLRHVTQLSELVDIATLDLSFISVIKVMDVVGNLLKPQGQLIVLIKPQFEAERGQVGKKGVIKDAKIHEEIVKKVVNAIEQQHFICKGVIESPIVGAQGNKEFLGYFIKE